LALIVDGFEENAKCDQEPPICPVIMDIELVHVPERYSFSGERGDPPAICLPGKIIHGLPEWIVGSL